MVFNVEFSSRAIRFLKKCNPKDSKRIIEKIKTLSFDPMPYGAVKIKQVKDNLYRIREGWYRVLYVIKRDENKILIAKIDIRDDHTYDDL